MAVVKDFPCPSCQSVGRDRTGDHLLVFPDGNMGCQRSHCLFFVTAAGEVKNWGHFEPGTQIDLSAIGIDQKQGGVEGTKEYSVDFKINNSKVEEITNSLPTGLSDREIQANIMSQYGVRFEFNQSDRSIAKHYYPITVDNKIVSYKCRECNTKTFSVVESTKGQKVQLFGMLSQAKKKGMNVVICEGELDAMSAYQMLEKHVPDLMCLSLPFGSNATKAISDNLEFLKAQDTITLCYDQDDPGYEGVENTWKLLPNVKVMQLDEKDANDCLKNMKVSHFTNAYFNASPFRPKVLASIEGMELEECIAPVQMGLSYPWDSLTKMTYGIHKNQVIGFGAAPGAGKTTLVRGIQQHLMFYHKEKIGIFSLEEKAEWTTRQLIGYIMNKPIHIPGTTYSQKDAENIKKQLEGKAYFYEHQYYTGKWLDIEGMIRYLYSIGVHYFFIDPLSSLVSHLTPSEANKYLSEAMFRLSILVQQLDITVFHVNHLNTAESGKSHEGGARVYASQFTGSRAQWRYSHGLIGVERDLLATDGTNNIMTLRYLKDRAFGNTGSICKLEYNKVTGRLEDVRVKF